jgi:hypothetical protein
MSWIKRILPWKEKKDCCSFWPDNGWQDCCCQHDVDYRKNPDGLTREEADKYMAECIKASGHPKMSQIMFCGVRLLGAWAWYKRRALEWLRK